MPARLDLIGQKFGRLTVLEYAGDRKWNCVCGCGEKSRVQTGHLRNGDTKSCGCLHRELTRKRLKGTAFGRTHGMTGTATHGTWKAMVSRCTNKSHKNYSHYGGRGITICEHWRKFENFLADMGEKPKGLTLERIDNDGNYEPGNCRWATQAEQSRNHSRNHNITLFGITLCLSDWAKWCGVNKSTVYARLSRGKTYEEALGIE
jgi:hypothetical protein